jgi:hypothetical protein
VNDRFERLEQVGDGGMGTVWRARDRTTGELVALKILHREGAADLERFVREAAILAELDHPGIVRYIAHGDGWLAMEWLDGETLAQRLLRGRLGVHESIDLVRRAAEALGAAHARGIVHRDVKPSNIFLAGERIKLLDFGVARRARERGPTQTGVMVGSAGYMAPEQVRGLRNLDARVDVFALGCVLYECVTGRPAFAGDDPLAMLSRMLLEPPPVPGIRELDALIAKMLAHAPSERPAGGAAVADALSHISAGDEAPSAPSGITAAERRLTRAEPLSKRAAPFVGRDRELAALAAFADEVREEGVTRRVRIVGPAGIGKTRLAEEIARREVIVAFEETTEPRLVIATAREPMPSDQWHELRLAPLLRKPSEKLAAHLLGPEATPEAIARLCERAAGNPRHLELLAAAGDEAVLAEVQTELDVLPAAARRLLRAASVLGQRFSRDGLAAIAGDVGSLLDDLVACEVLERAGDEFAFRRPLVWEAARATLTDDDRALAERLASRWRASRTS